MNNYYTFKAALEKAEEHRETISATSSELDIEPAHNGITLHLKDGDVRHIARLNEQQMMELHTWLDENFSVITYKQAFAAGYYCQWLSGESRYIFDPIMKPGDPDSAYLAWTISRKDK